MRRGTFGFPVGARVVAEQRQGELNPLSLEAMVAGQKAAGALGASLVVALLGAILLAWARGRLSMKTLRGTMDDTAKLTCMVLYLLLGSTAFVLVFRGLRIAALTFNTTIDFFDETLRQQRTLPEAELRDHAEALEPLTPLYQELLALT